jgi:hypothetical protein
VAARITSTPRRHRLIGWLLLASAAAASCGPGSRDASEREASAAATDGFDPALGSSLSAFLDTLQRRTFDWFWEQTDQMTGLTPDRTPTQSFSSIAATGFALTAYPIGVHRGWITRKDGRQRVLRTLRFLWEAPQNPSRNGAIGYRGFFYHFLDPGTGLRFGNVELSTVDTALLLAGALFCQSYFDQEHDEERQIRALADSLYLRVDWPWASVRPPTIGHGWDPEEGHLPYDWRGYNEAMLLYLLALGSPTLAVGSEAWQAWIQGYVWGSFEGYEHVGFAPMFGHQYTQVWFDLRGLRDEFLRSRDIDYFENSRRALLAQRSYALENPNGWRGYGERLWGLSACDGPLNGSFEIDGRMRAFKTYAARGASFDRIEDDGTISPTALGGSIVFAPRLAGSTLLAMREDHGERLFGRYGFIDALNPSFRLDVPVQHGWVHPEYGWYDTDYLGIDQGPILAMLENLRSELIWKTMRTNAHVQRGLRKAGFSGGWLDASESGP